MIRQLFTTVVAFAVLAFAGETPANGAGVELAPTLKVGEKILVLNGAGNRNKYLLDLYTAGLYLTQPSNQPASIIEADAQMVIRIVITSKMVSQEKMIASLEEGFQNSTRGDIEPLRADIQRFRQCFADEIVKGDIFDLVYLPGQGVGVFKNGKQQGAIAGLPFKRALFGIWLSEQPADARLKQALLGNGSGVRRQ